MSLILHLNVEQDPIMYLKSDSVIIKKDEAEPYDDDPAAYVVLPSFEDRVLPTKGKRMLNDLTLSAIPYSEVTNLSGGLTINIMSPTS